MVAKHDLPRFRTAKRLQGGDPLCRPLIQFARKSDSSLKVSMRRQCARPSEWQIHRLSRTAARHVQ